ncbi:MAG: PepSY-like domain-containing protein [Muribaculaceae bacterium]|nr:PepSY-like domain-containing protein [Muribaculaceae bacterium]
MKKFSFIFLPVIALLVTLMISCNGNNNASNSASQQQPADTTAITDSTAQKPDSTKTQPNQENLPNEVTSFVKQHFPNATIANTKTDKDSKGVELELTLNDGTKIDFDASNQWDKIECKTGAVPEKIVPQAIATYVKDNQQGQAITKIDKEDKGGYEIKLANGVELKFDQSGKFLSVDKN